MVARAAFRVTGTTTKALAVDTSDMVKEELDWEPKGADGHGEYEIWEHDLGAHQVNSGEVDGDISFDDVDVDE